jgi:hypothetical protein
MKNKAQSYMFIKLNKRSLILNIVLLLIFNIITFFMILYPEKFVSIFFRNEKIISMISIIGFMYFFLVLISRCIHLINTKNALIINENFIEDYTTYESLGRINWEDIQSIETKNTFSDNKYIEIRIKKVHGFPDEYNVNFLKKILIFMKNWNNKSTIIINNKFLEITFIDLENVLNKKFEEYKQR